MISIHVILITSILWPYWLCVKEQKLMKRQNPSRKNEPRKIGEQDKENEEEILEENYQLETIIRHEVGFQSFLSYLETEFSTENLLFWNSVEQLKNVKFKTIFYI